MILSSSLITAQEKTQMQCKENSDLSILGVEGKPQVNLVIAYKYSYKKTAAISLFSWERWEQKKKQNNFNCKHMNTLVLLFLTNILWIWVLI